MPMWFAGKLGVGHPVAFLAHNDLVILDGEDNLERGATKVLAHAIFIAHPIFSAQGMHTILPCFTRA